MLKILLKKGQEVFFTSDTHYGHHNIVKGVTKWDRNTRDFSDVEEMNENLVAHINGTVGEDDILFHLGDWSFGGIENIWKFRKQIHCKNIHLITGNHDHHIERNKILSSLYWGTDGKIYEDEGSDDFVSVRTQDLFSSVQKYLEVEICEPQGKSKPHIRNKFVLFHFPIASWNMLGKGMRHLHGHIHTSTKNRVGEGRMLDVGIDGSKYFAPISLMKVNRLLKDKKPKTMLTHGEDYHTPRIGLIEFIKNLWKRRN